MTDYIEVQAKLLSELNKETDPLKQSTIVNSMKTLAEAENLMRPEPTSVPEPTGVRGFFKNHADSLIKVGGTLATVSLIAAFEGKDLIFRSKASKYI